MHKISSHPTTVLGITPIGEDEWTDRCFFLMRFFRRQCAPIQKYSGAASLCRLLQDRGADAKSRVVPVLLVRTASGERASGASPDLRWEPERRANFLNVRWGNEQWFDDKSSNSQQHQSAVKQDPPELQIAFGRSLIQVIDKELLTKSGLQNVANTAKALLAKHDEGGLEITGVSDEEWRGRWGDVSLIARFLFCLQT